MVQETNVFIRTVKIPKNFVFPYYTLLALGIVAIPYTSCPYILEIIFTNCYPKPHSSSFLS